MKAEFMEIEGKGLCIVISEISFSRLKDWNDNYINNSQHFNDLNVIAEAIRQGKKILAIKEIRSQTGWGLKDAKEYLDKYYPRNVPYYERIQSDYDAIAEHFISDHSINLATFIDGDEFKL